jgi:hypothetical protein
MTDSLSAVAGWPACDGIAQAAYKYATGTISSIDTGCGIGTR